MRYLSEGISNQFQTDRDGRRVFYPYGSLGAGYVLQCPEQEQGLKKQNIDFLCAYNNHCLFDTVLCGFSRCLIRRRSDYIFVLFSLGSFCDQGVRHFG